MSRRMLFLVPVVASIAAAGGLAAADRRPAEGPVSGRAIRFDISPPLSSIRVEPRTPTGFRVEIPLRTVPDHGRPADRAGRQDPLRQVEERPLAGAALTPAPLLSFDGLSDDDNASVVGFRIVPPDTEGDIGPDHYVQWINLIFAVWDVTRADDGTPTGATLNSNGIRPGNIVWSGFGGPCESNNDGDPIVLYDHLADRWLLSQFSIDEGVQCVAVSTGGDPTGTYARWAFVVSPGQNNDYPKLGLMPDAYYLSLRDFPSNDGDFASAVAFDRAALLTGDPNAGFVKFSLPCNAADCPDGIQPPHLEGPSPGAGTPGIFSRFWDDDFDGPLTGSDGVRLWAFSPDFATPANSTFVELPFASGADFDSTMCGFFQRGCIPQPRRGGSERLDPVDELQMYRAQYRHFATYDSLVITTTVDATGNNEAGMRWAELRDDGSGWEIFQEGTYAPADGENRWMGSAAMDQYGNIALGYSVSSTKTFPSVRYTSRRAADPPGTMSGGEVSLVEGTGSQKGSSNRWGDYSAMSVDPTDDCTFWYTQEYYANSGSFDFKTRIGAFQVPPCGGDSSCTPTEEPAEVTCDDGFDNDCDGLIDLDDPDCAEPPTCELGLFGDPCDSDADCCSGKCRGRPGGKTCK